MTCQDTIQVISVIAELYEKEWEKRSLGFAREFLSRTWAGIPLPTLSVCGRGTQEIRYSKYLGYFLDPTKPHGVGTKYLNQMLAFLGYEKIDTYNAITETEKWIGTACDEKGSTDCIGDIVISTSDYYIFIEQKIKSGESSSPKSETNQLARYDQAIHNNIELQGKKEIRIFLTPNGKLSTKSLNWIPMSYDDLVNIGLKTLSSGGLSGIARENLKRFLMDLKLGPFEKEESEIQTIIDFAEKAIINKRFYDRLRFDQLVSNNRLLINLLMEG